MSVIFNMDTTYEDIMIAMLDRSHESTFTAYFSNGEVITYDRNKMYDSTITQLIESKVKTMRENYEKALDKISKKP